MTIVLILAALYAMMLAAFFSAWIVFREFRPALKTGGLSAIAFFIMVCVWLGLSEPPSGLDTQTLVAVILGSGLVTQAALTRWRIRPARGRATIGESIIIALISVAAMAGIYAAGVAWLETTVRNI